MNSVDILKRIGGFASVIIVSVAFLFMGCDSTGAGGDENDGNGDGDNGGATEVVFSDLSANGTSDTVTTTELTLTFDVAPTSLTADDITVTGATKGALSGEGTTRTLEISDITVGDGGTVTVEVTDPDGIALAIHVAFRRSPAAATTPSQRLWLKWLVTTPVVSLALFAFVALYPRATAGIAEGTVTPFTVLAGAMALLIYVFAFLILAAPEVPSVSGCAGDDTPEEQTLTDEDRDLADKVTALLEREVFRNADLTLESMAR